MCSSDLSPPWLGVLWAAVLVGASWLLERREPSSDRWLRWDLAPLVVAHGVALAAIGQAIALAGAGIPGAPVPAGARMQLALTASGAGLLACVVAAWRGRAGPYGIAPFALLALFLAANVSTNLVAYKPFWWVLALALASGQLAPRPGPAATPEGATRPCAA